ncbi:arylsulfatase A-like enzyme [Rhodopirellula rubra]|uniref:Arylsulfatase A-like enzyme n=1 Tax=Aporhodopirellula rubra TaxID=980271 RepID=A0A7W5DWR5_9BACT|nr:arylsulfatase [Aporhodopirellula rubra]MBB3205953.1 arylsulfatase A-like enzyme [Aporhodopirellula rubra]
MKNLLISLLVLPLSTVCFAEQPNRQKPNVIFILADDLGYGDLSCYGQTHFQTPHIDALAKRGMRFTQHYSGSAVCAPSRCSLMTGLHTGHTPVKGNAEHAPEGQMPMPADTFTIGHLLQSAGYQTGAFGKWGLGYPGSESDPLKMGFDRFYGYNCQRIAHCYYPAFLWNDDQRELLWGNVASHKRDYAPDLIHREAIDFIRENKDQPFFCYYAAIQPHADMVAPEEYMKRFRGKYLPEVSYPEDYYAAQPEGHAAFAAMVTVLDDYVGEIVAELDELEIAEDTLIIFSSDNGPHQEGGHDPEYFDSNGVVKGVKRDLYEGGVRVPMIAVWPGKIAAGTESDHVCAFWDFLPTMADLASVSLDRDTDGVSMNPTLLGRPNQHEHEYLYWDFPAQGGREALRKGNWKAVRYNINRKPDAPPELYDLSTDVGETNNVADTHPEIVEELGSLMSQARSK